MNNLSITTRILIAALLPALLVTMALSAYFVVNRVNDIEATELQRMRIMSNSLALASEFGLAAQNRNLLRGVAQSALSIPSIREIRFYDIDEQLLERHLNADTPSNRLGQFARVVRPWISSAPLQNQISVQVYRTDLSEFDDPLFAPQNGELTADNTAKAVTGVLAEKLAARSETAIGKLQLTVDLSAAYEKQLQIIERAVLITLIALLLVFVAAWFLAQTVIEPISALTDSVGKLARKDYSNIAKVRAGGELGVLSEAVSYLSDDLQSFHKQLTEATAVATRDLKLALDVLEQKNEELEVARRSAESASAFKSEFLANMSHEIRTPMNAIVGNLSLLSLSALNKEQSEQLAYIEQSSQTLLALIDEILDISKIESGNLELEIIETDVDDILHEVSSTVTNFAFSKGIEFVVSALPSEEARYVRTDPLRLKQLLTNLVHNAIKFTDRGHVLLGVEVLEQGPADVTIAFSVQDTGIGIPRDKFATLFSAFTQVDMSTTRKYGGTGLGLHICKSIVDLMHGELTLASTVGGGSQFDVILTLPLCPVTQHSHTGMSADSVVVRYRDTYPKLRDKYEAVFARANIQVVEELIPTDENLPVVVNISAQSLASPSDVAKTLEDSASLRIAMLSQITPTLKVNLEHAGFNGYMLRTPKPQLFKERLLQAVSGEVLQDAEGHGTAQVNLPFQSERLHVLAVDDQQINLELLTQFFDYLNVALSIAVSSDECLRMAASRKYDLIFLDLHMPGKDGFYTVRQIRQSGHLNHDTPVIAVTADAFSTTRERALQSGFDSLLTKPVTIDRVVEILSDWAGSGVAEIPMTAPQSALSLIEQSPVPEGNAGQAAAGEKPAKAGKATRQGKGAPVGNGAADPDSMISIVACAEAVMGNVEWARKAIRSYMEDIPGFVDEIESAVKSKDGKKLFFVAHSIKGVSQVCRVHKVAKLAQEVEQSSHDENWLEISRECKSLVKTLKLARTQCADALHEVAVQQ